MLNINFTIVFTIISSLLVCQTTNGQTSSDTSVHLKDVVQMVSSNYHLLQSKKYEANASKFSVELANYSKMPTIDASYQAGFGTANNLIGMFYPGNLLPITGPPTNSNNYNPVSGSAASILLNWQALTFGQRDAQIAVSVADAKAKQASYKELEFGYSINVISKYLDVLLAKEMLVIHQQNIERVLTLLHETKVLTTTGIKPGVDSALFYSELSKAKVAWLNAQNKLETEQLSLAQLIVSDKVPQPADSIFLNYLPVINNNPDSIKVSHPTIQNAEDQIALNNAKEIALNKSYLPKLNVWGTAFARGSGFMNDGSSKTWDGFGITRYNYGAGVQLLFPIMKYGEAKKQLQQQSMISKAAEENLLESKKILSTQQLIANTTYKNSLAIAKEAGLQRIASNYAFNAMQIRYKTGLVNYSELIQSQYNLLKAELDIKQAYWEAWKALLFQAAVKGDISIFLREIR